MHSVIDYLRRATRPERDSGLSDVQLLQRVAGERDDAAFELLVWRHAGLVLSTARALLRDAHTVDDVFQATFLALFRQAATVRSQASIAGWLHKVAYRIAFRARRKAAHVPIDDHALSTMPDTDASVHHVELGAALEEELAHLPDHYRVPLVLFYFQGMSADEVAREMNCPRGTVLSRLQRGRERLRRRLRRRELGLGTATVLTRQSSQRALAVAPRSLIRSTVRNAQSASSGAHLVKMAQGALRTMLWTKIKIAATLVLTACLGTCWLLRDAVAQQPMPQESTKAARVAQAPISDQRPAAREEKQGRMIQLDEDVNYVCWSPDGRTFATWSKSGILKIWDARTGKVLHALPSMKKQGFNTFRFSPDGRMLAVTKRRSIEAGDVIEVWDVKTAKKLVVNKLPYGRSRLSFDFSPDGTMIAMAYGGPPRKICGGARVVVLETGQVLYSLEDHPYLAISVAYSPDGKLLATGGHKGEILIWDVQTAKVVRTLKSTKSPLVSLRFSPDAKTLASCSHDGAWLWNVATGKATLLKEAGVECSGVQFHPDGTRLTVVKQGYNDDAPAVTQLLDVATGKVLRTWKKTLFTRVAFAAKGKQIAILHADRKLRWWQLNAGE